MKDVSIIIVNYNTEKLTKECVESIYKNDKDLDFEIILVDNGSKKGGLNILSALEKKYKNLTFIKNKKNLGYAKANNIGIKKATSDFLLLLNSDTKIGKNAITAIVEYARKTEDAGVIGSRLLNPDKRIQPSCYNLPSIKNAVKEFWMGEKGYFEKFAPKGNKPVEVEAVVGASFLITPIARKKVGLLDERYFMYFEDLDYCRRVKKAGLKVYYLPDSKVIHYHGTSGKKLANEENQWRRLIPSSKIYHGVFKHYLLNIIILTGSKFR